MYVASLFERDNYKYLYKHVCARSTTALTLSFRYLVLGILVFLQRSVCEMIHQVVSIQRVSVSERDEGTAGRRQGIVIIFYFLTRHIFIIPTVGITFLHFYLNAKEIKFRTLNL